MNIAIYHPWVYLKGGIERTLVELISRSRHDWTLFTNHFAEEHTFPEFGQFRVIELPRVSVKRNALSVARASARLLTQQVDFSPFDLVVICSEGIGDLVALRTKDTPVVCLCFTPLKAVHDQHAIDRLTRGRTMLAERAGMKLFELVDRFAWKRYQHVFCISHEVRRRVIASGLADGIETEVVHPGVDLALMTPGEDVEPFFLVPGRIMWTKNIELAIAAFREFRRLSDHESKRLVIAGMVDDKSRTYLDELRSLADGLPVEFVLSPSDEELFALYRRCQVVIFPPPNEDWGLVPLEAMAFAKPVIAIDRGGPRETVVNGETGILCDDDGPGAMASAMSTLAETDVAVMMGRAGRERAAQFEWSKFVERIDSFAEDFAGLPARVPSALGVGGARES